MLKDRIDKIINKDEFIKVLTEKGREFVLRKKGLNNLQDVKNEIKKIIKRNRALKADVFHVIKKDLSLEKETYNDPNYDGGLE